MLSSVLRNAAATTHQRQCTLSCPPRYGGYPGLLCPQPHLPAAAAVHLGSAGQEKLWSWAVRVSEISCNQTHPLALCGPSSNLPSSPSTDPSGLGQFIFLRL